MIVFLWVLRAVEISTERESDDFRPDDRLFQRSNSRRARPKDLPRARTCRSVQLDVDYQTRASNGRLDRTEREKGQGRIDFTFFLRVLSVYLEGFTRMIHKPLF